LTAAADARQHGRSPGTRGDRDIVHTLRLCLLAFCLAAACRGHAADGTEHGEPLPSFAELEAAGAVIGDIRVDPQDVFDEKDTRENYGLYRVFNVLHIQTRQSVIRRQLLFRSGERVSLRVIEETERLLRGNSYIYDVAIRPVAFRNGVVDIEVRTRDTWSLQPGASFSRGGGSNTSGLSLAEKNFLGTGVGIGFSTGSSVDRSGREFEIHHNQVFGDWTSFSYKTATLSDGSAESVSLQRPFYALDTRWALGASAGTFDRIDSIYTNGAPVGQFRHQQSAGQVFAGWSRGLVDGWVHRYSVGVGYQDDLYLVDPAYTPPAQLPADQTLAYPFVRYELIEDKYVKVINRDKIGRAEYFALGWSASLQVGRSSTGFGATRDLWLYSGAVNKGFRFEHGGDLLAGISFSGQNADGSGERQYLAANARYYLQYAPRWVFYASATADAIRNPYVSDQLTLGGDNGLRGYPLRYQSGNQRALFTVEQRVYTDWYPFRLVRIGGAVFFDIGRAWGGDYENPAAPGWLKDFGFGLRLTSDRSSSGNVLHLDVAFPIDADSDIKKAQIVIKTYAGF
jgi:hemolysin activation/secretion protein